MCKYIAGIIITPTMKGVLLLNFFVGMRNAVRSVDHKVCQKVKQK